MSNNRDAIASYLAGTLRFTRAGVAGALGNMQVESGFSPTAYNAGEGAIGICQWELGRRTRLQAYAARHGGKETDLAMQLGYLATELQSAEFAEVLLFMRTTAGPTAAAIEWDANFERSAGTTRQQRIANANRIYGELAAAPPAPAPKPAPTGEEPPMIIVRRKGGGRAWLLVGPKQTLILRGLNTIASLRAAGIKVVSADGIDYDRFRKGSI